MYFPWPPSKPKSTSKMRTANPIRKFVISVKPYSINHRVMFVMDVCVIALSVVSLTGHFELIINAHIVQVGHSYKLRDRGVQLSFWNSPILVSN